VFYPAKALQNAMSSKTIRRASRGSFFRILRDRPLSLKRYPNGHQEQFFFQKDAEDKVPIGYAWSRFFSEQTRTRFTTSSATDAATLVYLANLACIDQNPWMSRIGSARIVPTSRSSILDPTRRLPYSQIVEARSLSRIRSTQSDSRAIPNPGGDECNIYIPLDPVYTYEQVRSFAELPFSVVVINQNAQSVSQHAQRSRSAESQGLFRLPPDFERQDNRGSLCFCGPTRSHRFPRRSTGPK